MTTTNKRIANKVADLREGMVLELRYLDNVMKVVYVKDDLIEEDSLEHAISKRFARNIGSYDSPIIELIHVPRDRILFDNGAIRITTHLHPELFEPVMMPDEDSSQFRYKEARYHNLLKYLQQGGLAN